MKSTRVRLPRVRRRILVVDAGRLIRARVKSAVKHTADVVHATAFLLENEAVNGINLNLDGGWLLT